MKLYNRLFFFAFLLFRIFAIISCLALPTVGTLAVALVLCSEIAFSVGNIITRDAIDRSVTGATVPWLYLLGLVRIVTGKPGIIGDIVLVTVAAAQLWTMWHLRTSLTISVPAWVRLRDTGPYRLIRHPQDALTILSRLAFLVTFPAWQNALALVSITLAVVLHILAEEHFLKSRDEWVPYSERVTSRLIPGFW